MDLARASKDIYALLSHRCIAHAPDLSWDYTPLKNLSAPYHHLSEVSQISRTLQNEVVMLRCILLSVRLWETNILGPHIDYQIYSLWAVYSLRVGVGWGRQSCSRLIDIGTVDFSHQWSERGQVFGGEFSDRSVSSIRMVHTKGWWRMVAGGGRGGGGGVWGQIRIFPMWFGVLIWVKCAPK